MVYLTLNSVQLVKYITYMTQNGDYVAGHSIFKGRDIKANQILTDGLIIQDASRGITFTARRFESKFEDNLLNLKDLSNESKEVVIISIPKELLETYEPKYFESYDSSSIILEDMGQYSSIYKDVYGNPTRMASLPSIYILGYINVQKDIFINNSTYAFDTYKRDINVSNLKPILEKRYEKILGLRKRIIDSVNTEVKDLER